MESENLSKHGSNAPIFTLNRYCVLEIFERLDLNVCINLVEAIREFQWAADWIYKTKYSKYVCKDTDIVVVIPHLGSFLRSLKIICNQHPIDYSHNAVHLEKLLDMCSGLQRLEVIGCGRTSLIGCVFSKAVDNLEELKLTYCNFGNNEDFFGNLRNLKYLNTYNCTDLPLIALAKCFNNNPAIARFTCSGSYASMLPLYKSLPNLDTLTLMLSTGTSASTPINISTLKKLSTLALFGWYKDIDAVLSGLKNNVILKSLALFYVEMKESTFKLLKTFPNLETLWISPLKQMDLPVFRLPPKLNSLHLEHFNISPAKIVELLEHLPYLEMLELCRCDTGIPNDCIDLEERMEKTIKRKITRRFEFSVPSGSYLLKRNWNWLQDGFEHYNPKIQKAPTFTLGIHD